MKSTRFFLRSKIRLISLILLISGIFAVAFAQGKAADPNEGKIPADKLAEARAIIGKSSGPSATWTGPTTGPAAQGNKRIVFVASDLTNGGTLAVSEGVKEAAKVIGWKVDVIDGRGSANDQVAGLNQAIASKPDGIIIGGWTPVAAKNALAQASKLGIPVVGWHATSKAGPAPEFNMFFNVTTDALEVARTAALYAIATSNGQVRAVVFTDSNYQIAIDKANVMRDVVTQYGGKVLEYVDTPIAETSKRMPALTSRLIQSYGTDFYALAINDNYFTGMKSVLKQQALKGMGPPWCISAGDGDAAAFARIRNSDYQTATVPEPLYLQGWQLTDELNRAMAKQAPSGYIPPVFVVSKDSITSANVYDPAIGYRDAYRKIWKK